MAFSYVTITGSYPGKTGTVTVTPVTEMTNSGQQISSREVYPIRNGSVLFRLAATDDPGTDPAGAEYVVSIQVAGQAPVQFSTIIPSALAGGNLDLSQLPYGYTPPPPTVAPALAPSNNLSDLTNPSAARTNLGLGSAATQPSSAFDPAGLAATDSAAATAAAEAQSLLRSNNLSDLASATVARANLGLGSAATQATSAFDPAGAAAAVLPLTGTAGAPTSGTWTAGQLAKDSAGRVWACAVSGTPGTWVLSGAFVGSGADPNLHYWQAAAAYRRTSTARIVVIGDSIVEGNGAAGYSGRWVDFLGDILRSQWPTGDNVGHQAGYIPVVRDGTVPSPWTVTGTPVENNNFGLGSYAYQMSAGQVLSVALTGTSVDIYYTTGGSTGQWAYQVDSGAVTSVTNYQSGSLLSQKVRVTLGGGVHTLKINGPASGTSFISGIEVFNGNESQGFSILGAGHSGYTSAGFPNGNWTLDYVSAAPNLTIIALGANDPGNGISAATTQANLTTLGQLCLSRVPAQSLLFVANYVRSDYGIPAVWSTYVAAIRAAAAACGAACIDMSARMPVVGSSEATALNIYADTVHPNARGHALYADHVARSLISSFDRVAA